MKAYSKLTLFSFLFTLPATVLFLLFVYYPFMSSIYYSFTRWDGVNTPVYIGLTNYVELFRDPAVWHGMQHTLSIVVFGMLIGNPLSLLLALALNQPLKSKSLLRTIFYMPVIISLMVVSITWGFILKYDGVLNALLTQLGLGGDLKDWLGNVHTALPLVILINVWQGTGFGAVIYLAGLQSIPRELIEAAHLDGASGWRKLLYITIPLIMPVITLNTFFTLVGALKFFDLPFVLTNGGPGDATLTIAMAIYKFAFVNQNYGYATAAGVLFMILVLLVTTLQLRFTRNKEVEY